MLLSNGMTHSVLAVNYRNRGETLMGCWKGCRSWDEAIKWLELRRNKTPTSPRGGKILRSMDEVKLELKNTDHPSLKMALESYLRFCEGVSVGR